jgi:hypothetical protein
LSPIWITLEAPPKKGVIIGPRRKEAPSQPKPLCEPNECSARWQNQNFVVNYLEHVENTWSIDIVEENCSLTQDMDPFVKGEFQVRRW